MEYVFSVRLFLHMLFHLWLWLFLLELHERVCAQKRKDTIVQFYLHDNFLGPHASSIVVAAPGGNLSTPGFGTVAVFDYLLTEGPSPKSSIVGRGQGTSMVDSFGPTSLLLTFSAVFDASYKYSGTLSFHGSVKTQLKQREIAVIGGTGAFRFATGFAVIEIYSTQNFSPILFYNVTVRH